MLLKSEDVRALTDLGFLAISRGFWVHAVALFEGVQAARPEQQAGYIGRALVDILLGNFEGAIKTLRTIPPSDEARAFLGLALLRYGDKEEGMRILKNVAKTASLPSVAEMAQHFMEANP